jgi:predicted AlkP superfamily phosphohydrolase/phosphomutase
MRTKEADAVSRVVVVGLDGLNPDLVDLWMDDLPALRGIMAEGCYGRIQSTVPPITPQAWTCAQCGKNPGHYGFWDFSYRSDFSYGEPNLIDRTGVKVPTLYKILPRRGKRVAIINVPVTFPPPRIPNGYAISSFLTPDVESQFTHPPELKQEITERFGEYIIDASTPELNYRQMDKDAVLKRIYDMDTQRFEILKHFIETKECDYIFCVIMGTDRMPHLFYRYFDENHVRYTPHPKYSAALHDHYVFCDTQLAQVRTMLDADTALVVHSDHSVQRLDGRICLNDWLIKQGHMKLKEPFKSLTPLRNAVDEIDWPNTVAWATGYTGQIYLNVRGREAEGAVPPSDYDKLLEELGEQIKAIPSPDGRELDTRIFKRKEIHHGRYAEYGPDLFIYFDNCRWNIDEQLGHESVYSYDTTKGPDDGGHGPEGFFAMVGPGIEALGEIRDFSLLDVAPTVMHLMGLEVPEDMEGRVLTQG